MSVFSGCRDTYRGCCRLTPPQVHIMEACHYHQLYHVINCLHLKMRLGGDSPGLWNRLHEKHFNALFFLLLFISPSTFLFLITVWCPLPQPPSLTASFLLFFSSNPSSTPCVPPSIPLLCLFDILPSCELALFLSSSSVILPCSCHLSCPHSLSCCPASFFIISHSQALSR